MDLGLFLNGYATNAQVLLAIALADVAVLAAFSVLYNHWVGKLGERIHGYSALLVAIGNAITLVIISSISWKASVLVGLGFVVSGAAMIIGDVNRANAQREQAAVDAKRPRRKALPYAAAGLIDEAIMLMSAVERGLKAQLEGKSDDRKLGLIALSAKEASIKLVEARRVEG